MAEDEYETRERERNVKRECESERVLVLSSECFSVRVQLKALVSHTYTERDTSPSTGRFSVCLSCLFDFYLLRQQIEAI